jgi:hypothetical protein
MNKQLPLGVVAALLMAGGQANAQVACPTSPTVMSSVFGTTAASIASFSCTIGDKTFDDFSFPGGNNSQFLGNLVNFAISGPDTSIAFRTSSATGVGFGNGTHMFDFTVTIDPADVAAGTRIVTYRIDTGGVAGLSTSATITGSDSGTNVVGPLAGSRMALVDLAPGDTFNVAAVSTTQSNPSAGRLNSLINTFTQSTPVSVSEPMSLALFGLGLAGLGFARRRRS